MLIAALLLGAKGCMSREDRETECGMLTGQGNMLKGREI